MAMHVATAYMATVAGALPTTRALKRLVVGDVDDWQFTLIARRRDLATVAVDEGTASWHKSKRSAWR